MSIRKTLGLASCLALVPVLMSCKSEAPSKTSAPAAAVETQKARQPGNASGMVGGCVLASPAAEAPADPYQETAVEPTDEYKPFTKKLAVYGITLIASDDISDEFIRNVAATVKEMFPRGVEGIDPALQRQVLDNLYRYRAAIPLFKGQEHEFAGKDEEDWAVTTSRNSICDIIMEGVPGQVNEVVEHILHHVSDVGLNYTFPGDWGISTTSRLYRAMQAAIDGGYYNVAQYDEIDKEEHDRVLLQEYAYWVIYDSWNLRETYGPKQAEFSIMNAAGLEADLPLSWELFETTIPKVMRPPSKAMLEKFLEQPPAGR
jgi:hypothetical protein